jgi:23S rRNA pseudouridine2604 synthase
MISARPLFSRVKLPTSVRNHLVLSQNLERACSSSSIGTSEIRLIKRMSQLNLASRREADRLIAEGRVLVDGIPAKLGQKVEVNCTNIKILSQDTTITEEPSSKLFPTPLHASSLMPPPAVVLNKPIGYVSGQPEHDHIPAIRLLTNETLYPTMNEDLVDYQTSVLDWEGYAPAGRLDKDSSGLLVFTNHGILAKHLVGSDHNIEKEYIVTVEPAGQVSRRERIANPNFILPPVTYSLSRFHRGGSFLMGDTRPLKKCKAKWVEHGRLLKLTLQEGRKHQIRRMCRELLGLHVTALERVRIGPIALGDLPVGSWRPITKAEYDEIIGQ